jgi:hypothetical protein
MIVPICDPVQTETWILQLSLLASLLPSSITTLDLSWIFWAYSIQRITSKHFQVSEVLTASFIRVKGAVSTCEMSSQYLWHYTMQHPRRNLQSSSDPIHTDVIYILYYYVTNNIVLLPYFLFKQIMKQLQHLNERTLHIYIVQSNKAS